MSAFFSAFKKLFILCLVFSMSIIVILELFPTIFIGMFTSDAQIIEIGKKRNSGLYVINVINGYADRLSADFPCSRAGKRISVFWL